MGDLPLPKRHLRFHYGGKYEELHNTPSKLLLYSGGATIDTNDWDGDEVFMGDLVKEVDKLIGIPENHVVELRWLWLCPKDGYVNQLVHVVGDGDVVFMFKNAKPDNQNFLHLYIDFVRKPIDGQCSQNIIPSEVPHFSQISSVVTKAKKQKNTPKRGGKKSDKLLTRWSNRNNAYGGDHGGDHFVNKQAHVVELSDEEGNYEDGVEVLNNNVIDLNFSSLNEFPEDLNPTQDFNSVEGIFGEDELRHDYCLNELNYEGFLGEDEQDVTQGYGEDVVEPSAEDDWNSVEASGNLGNYRLDDELSEEDIDYVPSEDTSIQVHKKKIYVYSTRSKEALGDIDRIDAESDYDSPNSETDSEVEDDGPLRKDELEKAKEIAEAVKKAQIERTRAFAYKISKQQSSFREKNKAGPQTDRDLEWIKRTSRVEDEEHVGAGDDGGEYNLFVEQRWSDVYKCRSYLKTHAIKKKFVLTYLRNDPKRVIALCKGKDVKGEQCKWRASCGMMNDNHSMRLGVLQPVHTHVSYNAVRNSTAKAPWIAEQIQVAMRHHCKSYTPREIIGYMWYSWQITIKYWQAWHSLTLALELVHGNYENSYKMVPEMCRQILLANPGSIASYSRDDTYGMFESCCLCLKASIDGFVKGCRPLIGLDGCFLKGKYGGTCLAIVALDGNNGMFPLAIYVCVRENQDSWTDFLNKMHPYLSRHKEPLTIMSDRQKGLNAAVASIFPNCHQRFCFRHMTGNMKRYFKGVEDLSWAASKSYANSWFNFNMEELAKIDAGAAEYLMAEPPSRWARAHFDVGSKSEHTTNNWTEAFNARILEARDKPIVGLVTTVLSLLMKLQFERRNTCKTWDKDGLVPRVLEILQEKKKLMCKYDVYGSDDHTYEVKNSVGKSWIVDLEGLQCTCQEWQLTGIPCSHAVRVIDPIQLDWKKMCSPYFTVENYSKVYEGSIKPIRHVDDWNKELADIHPPLRPRAPGRPPMQRKRGLDEGPIRYGGKKQIRCSVCKGYNHNKTTCPGGGPEFEAFLGATAQGPAKRGATPRGGRPRTRPRKVLTPAARAYAAAMEQAAREQQAAMEEALLSGMSRGRASTRGRGRGKGKGRGTPVPPPAPFYPTPPAPFYPTSPFYPTPQMHPTAAPTRVPMPPMPPTHTYQYRPPMPRTSTSFQLDPTDPNPQPYMRAGNQTRQIFRPPNVFNFGTGNTTMSETRLADLLGVGMNTQASTSNPTQRSSQASNTTQRSSQASNTNPTSTSVRVTRWML